MVSGPWEEDEDRDDFPEYRSPSDIAPNELSGALQSLYLIGDDPYLRMQALNLSVVDQFIMKLEYETRRKLIDEERTPMPEAVFLSAQSQMWIFAAYEILRTWRERAKGVVKAFENGGLELKVEALEKELDFVHVGRQLRAMQLRRILEDPSIIQTIKIDLRRSHMAFARIEHLRVSLAKHEVSGKANSIAYDPGYGRINQWCGSLDYQLEQGAAILGTISRRDIAEDIRHIPASDDAPSDETIKSFDTYMRGPPSGSAL